MSPSVEASNTPSQPTGAARMAPLDKVELLKVLGQSLHRVGLPSHRLESGLERVAARLATSIEIFSLPTGFIMSVDAGSPPTTVAVRIAPCATDLERLARLSNIVESLSHGILQGPEARLRIERVMQAPPRWGRGATVLAYVLSAAAFSVIFGGGWIELAIATCVGLAVGLLSVLFERRPISRRLFELSAATAAALITNIAYALSRSFVEWIPLASGLIILLPGLALVDAVEELAHGHLTSGASRLAGVGVVLLAMTFGALLGLVVVEPFDTEVPPAEALGLPSWCVVPALLAIALGSTIRFRGRGTDIPTALVASTLALAGARLGAAFLGELAGPFLAALVLGLGANLFVRISRQPAELFAVPGLALLVPGSFGVRSMAALLSDQTTVGVETAFRMFLTAMALVTGLLVSSALLRERAR